MTKTLVFVADFGLAALPIEVMPVEHTVSEVFTDDSEIAALVATHEPSFVGSPYVITVVETDGEGKTIGTTLIKREWVG